MAENTLGRRIVDPEIHEVRIFNETFEKEAEVVSIDAYSGHADMADLDNFVLKVEGLKRLILVHGEMHQMEPFATRLKVVRPGLEIMIPDREEVIFLQNDSGSS
jgi:metallo-beta-lactamase family protein